MTIAHHPTDATLAAFAAGTLDEGRALVVATHLSLLVRTAAARCGLLNGCAASCLKTPNRVAWKPGALQRALRADFVR